MIQIAESPDIFGSTIFCDDIRFEVDGKVSYIGTYGPRMLVNVPFPVTLPKFAFGISFWQKRAMVAPKISIQIFLPGDPDEQPSFDIQSETPQVEPADDSKFMVVKANIVTTSLVLKNPGALMVRVLREGVLHPLGRLKIEASSQVSTALKEPANQ